MSSLAVTIERLTILPHTNADALELAAVGGYRAVVLKGAYKTGDYALYIPEQAILPDALIEEIGLTGKLAGGKHNRVKAITLRGELSQGIVCRPKALASVDVAAACAARTDFAELLGITKWVPEVPASMAGKMVAAPGLLPWIEIENIKRYPDMFVPGEPVTASEKIHGTCCLISLDRAGTLLVSSKGFGARRLAILEDDANVYWRAVHVHDVARKAAAILERLGAGVANLGLFAEVYGAGIQDLTYGVASRNTPGLAVFDARIMNTAGQEAWLDQGALRALCAQFDLPVVPEIYSGPYDYARLSALAEGQTLMGGVNIREGVVVRPAVERIYPALNSRTIAKFVSAAYLTRGGNATEYE